ncbi:MAG TPA: DUF3455 domain-containing protein [Pseudolabrys sp.]|nr:DUF3455 domain-containing protein [Pseudolabrys sp.]
MTAALKKILCIILLGSPLVSTAQAIAPLPPGIAVHGAKVVATFHAEGVQVYECKLDAGNKLVWRFREPVAALMDAGNTIGLHYAGPSWQHIDGSAIQAKMVSAVPGATFNDVPWLKLEVTEQRGAGLLSNVKMVQRIDTKGGMMQGACDAAGALRSVPFSADFVFFH